MFGRIKGYIIKKLIHALQIEEKEKELERELFGLYKQSIELNRRLKNLENKKITVVFVCNMPQEWHSLKTLYDACMADRDFYVIIVTIPMKKMILESGLYHEIYENQGADEFFANYPCKVIRGYDYEKKEWFNLRNLDPDYLFFQAPYDIHRPDVYASREVAQYTQIGYIAYGMAVIGGGVLDTTTPSSFFKNVSYIFSESDERKNCYEKIRLASPNGNYQKIKSLGFPRFDNYRKKSRGFNCFWKNPCKNKIRILWIPRWTKEEGLCNFFDYKDKLFDFVEQSNEFELLFRPHPLTFSNFIFRGEMSEEEVLSYKKRYADSGNCAIDEDKDYWTGLASTDVILADATSLLAEAFLTEKPIIYCHKDRDLWTDFGKRLYEGFYVANCWDDVNQFLEQLRIGKDPLRSKREQIIKELYNIPEQGAGVLIKDYLKKEFRYSRTESNESINLIENSY